MAAPSISVILPTYNRLGRLKRVLDGLKQQDYPSDKVEIIVVSDGSTDGTDQFLAAFSEAGTARPLFQSNQGPAAARNRGLAAAGGELIVFVDDDVVPTPSFLTEHVRAHHSAGRDVAVIGPLLTPLDFKLSPWVEWEQQMLMKQYDAMLKGLWRPSARQFYTGNASINREILQAAGGFNAQFRRAEDVELAYRLADRGIEFVFANLAVGLHYAERSFDSWLGVARAYGRNDAIFVRDLRREWLVPNLRSEFSRRKLPLRILIGACVDRPRLAAALSRALGATAGAFGALGAKTLERNAYSTLFNLEYYRSFVDEIGEANFLFQDGELTST